MPLVTEHLRRDPSHPNSAAWEQIGHHWTFELTHTMSSLIEEDGGPRMAAGSGYGDLWDRPAVDHTFTQDYPLPKGEPPIKRGGPHPDVERALSLGT
jgi:hypothetical protein